MIIHRGLRYQEGRGIGGFFSSIFRGLKPLISMGLSTGKRILNSDMAKSIGRTALDIGKEAVKNVAVDVLTGKPIKESVDKELESAKEKIATKIRGSGKNRKRVKPKKHQSMNHCLAKKKKYCLLD